MQHLPACKLDGERLHPYVMSPQPGCTGACFLQALSAELPGRPAIAFLLRPQGCQKEFSAPQQLGA
eukprot:1143932-Pelagomonas_calceolata.AAC.4